MENTQTLSLVMPALNEERTLESVVHKVMKVNLPYGFKRELIIINDGSRDRTLEIANSLAKQYPEIKVLDNGQNIGKSASVKKGILATSGEYVLIQDADLEYDPNEIPLLITQALEKDYDVVYGNRFGKKNSRIYVTYFLGNKVLSMFSNFFTFWRFKKIIPDMEVCYKLIKGDIIRNIAQTLVSKTTFGFEPEITAKLSRYKTKNGHLKISIVPISYFPRKISEGKKIKWTDGVKAIIEIVKFNLF